MTETMQMNIVVKMNATLAWGMGEQILVPEKLGGGEGGTRKKNCLYSYLRVF